MPTTGLQGCASAQELDTEVLNSETISNEPQRPVGEREDCANYVYNIIFQMKIDSPKNADGKDANKCSLWRLCNFFLFLVLFVYPLPKLHWGIVFYQKACANIFIQALRYLMFPQNFDVLKNLIITGNFKRSQ